MYLCVTGNVHQLHRHRKGKVERIDLNFLSNQQVRAIAHSAPALQSDYLAHVFDSTNLVLASDHQARAFDSPILVVVEDRYQSDAPPAQFVWSSSLLISYGVVTLREFVETVAPLPTVDVKSVTVIRMTVARQSLNKAYSVSHQNQRKKLRRHKLKGP